MQPHCPRCSLPVAHGAPACPRCCQAISWQQAPTRHWHARGGGYRRLSVGQTILLGLVACAVLTLCASISGTWREAQAPNPTPLRTRRHAAGALGPPTAGARARIRWRVTGSGFVRGEVDNVGDQPLVNVVVKADVAEPQSRSGFYVGNAYREVRNSAGKYLHPDRWPYDAHGNDPPPLAGPEWVIAPGDSSGFSLAPASLAALRNVEVFSHFPGHDYPIPFDAMDDPE